MSYELKKEQLMYNTNLDEWQQLWCINPYIVLRHSPLRPAAHGRWYENCVWYSMDIKVKEQDVEKWRSLAIHVKL